MKSWTKIPLLGVMLGSLTLLSGCFGGSDNRAGVVIPADADFVIMFDYTDGPGSQRAELEALFEALPAVEFKEELVESFYDDVLPADKELREKVQQIVAGEWQMAMAVEEVNAFDIDNFDVALENGDANMNIGLYFEEADLFEEVLLMEGEVTVTKEDGFIVYYDKDSDEKIYRDGGLFALTTNKGEEESLKERMKSGEVAFDLKDDSSKLGYLYVDADMQSYGEYLTLSMPQLDAEDVGDVYLKLTVDGGLRFSGDLEFDAGALEEGEVNYKGELLGKVPGDGAIFYYESFDFAKLVAKLQETTNSTIGKLEGSGQGPDYSYLDLINTIADTFGVSDEAVEAVFSSPFAFQLGYEGGYVPVIALYLQLEEDETEMAREMKEGMDQYTDEVAAWFDVMMSADLGVEVEGALKVETTSVMGGPATKMSLDWEAMPPELLGMSAAFGPDFKMNDLKFELYYGVTGDDVFFVSFYPDFDQAYGESVLGESATIEEALAGVEGNGATFMSFDLRPFVDWMSFIVEKVAEVMPPAEYAEAQTVLSEMELWTSHFNYFAFKQGYEDGKLTIDAYLRMQ